MVGLGHGAASSTHAAGGPPITGAQSSSAVSPPTGRVPDLARSKLAVDDFFADLNRDDVDGALSLVCTESQEQFRRAVDNLTGVRWGPPKLIRHTVEGEQLLLRYTIQRQRGSATRRFQLLVTMISEDLHPVICAITG